MWGKRKSYIIPHHQRIFGSPLCPFVSQCQYKLFPIDPSSLFPNVFPCHHHHMANAYSALQGPKSAGFYLLPSPDTNLLLKGKIGVAVSTAEHLTISICVPVYNPDARNARNTAECTPISFISFASRHFRTFHSSWNRSWYNARQ